MQINMKQYGSMFWRRIGYFMKAKRISHNRFAISSGYSYRSFLQAKCSRNIPLLPRLILMADTIGISLEELCDFRIPVDQVEIPDPIEITDEYLRNEFEVKKEYYRRVSMEDTRRILGGMDPVSGMQKNPMNMQSLGYIPEENGDRMHNHA